MIGSIVPRFVILEHTGSAEYKPGVHWDLMLEVEGGLRTWELDGSPSDRATIRATESGFHRPDYLDYEGPVSGNRGSVRRWDCGTYQVLSETAAELELAISAQKIAGRMLLQRDVEDGRMWSLRFISNSAKSAGK